MTAASMTAFAMLLASTPAAAQKALVDPTRPPIVAPLPQTAAEAKPPGPALQSVLISPGRRIAVINGKPVALGERIGEATLVRVTETEAVLKQGAEMRVLKLYPSVMKMAVQPATAEGSGGANGANKQ